MEPVTVEKCHKIVLIGVRQIMNCYIAERRCSRKLKENQKNCDEGNLHVTAASTHAMNRICGFKCLQSEISDSATCVLG